MLTLTIPGVIDGWDPVKKEFVQTTDTTILMEHSLLAISKWESKWKKPFLVEDPKTYEEAIDYYKCMTITQNVNPDVYRTLKPDTVKEITDYINDKMTATTINNRNKRGPKQIVTSELIYCWMTQFGIPFECQKWHLNRLLMLIEVCSIKSEPEKKMPRREAIAQRNALNAARRAKYNTNG